MSRLLKYVFYDLLRDRFILAYTLFLWVLTSVLFQFDADAGKVILSLMNVVLLVVPLVSIVFSTIHYFNSYEFMELMLVQPIPRKVVFLSQYVGVASSLATAFGVGVGLPVMLFGGGAAGVALLLSGLLLTLVFVSLAFLAAVLTPDKARAIGLALLFWIYFALIYDGLLLWVVYTFSDYPLEKITLVLIAMNPVDLARIILLLQLDISALMGYTGAFYQQFFGSILGLVFSAGVLLIWIALPLFAAYRLFAVKDL
ncbi:MAG: ABC transporter permease [Cyclobacteriaceae bacterium]|jgi:Cu-processing system permease protein|nr:ABC transporter permease [Cyclobacteriaceae bacterium]